MTLDVREVKPEAIDTERLFDIMFNPETGAFYREVQMIEGLDFDLRKYFEDTTLKPTVPKTSYTIGSEDKFLGFVSYASRIEGEPVLVLEDLCLDVESRGKGLGRRLVEETLKLEMSKLNGRKLIAYVAMQGNPRSLDVVRFFERLGFSRDSMIMYLAKNAPNGRSTVDYLRMVFRA